jgi:hypothetical protein
MSFTSERDLRKAVPKKNNTIISKQNKSNSTIVTKNSTDIANSDYKLSSSSIDIVEQAKKERENRIHIKELNNKIVIIQKFIRGKVSSIKYKKLIRNNFDSKLNDIQKVIKLLPTQFIPPPEICFDILLKLLFLLKIKNISSNKYDIDNDINRLLLFFRILLLPSLSQLEFEKNIMFPIYTKRRILIIINLFKICLKIITIKRLTNDDSHIITECLNYLVGIIIIITKISNNNNLLLLGEPY